MKPVRRFLTLVAAALICGACSANGSSNVRDGHAATERERPNVLEALFPSLHTLNASDIDAMRKQCAEQFVDYQAAYEQLKGLGITLNAGVDLRDVVCSDADNFAATLDAGITVMMTPHDAGLSGSALVKDLLFAMGLEDWTTQARFSDSVTYVDFESIAMNGAYVALFEQLSTLVAGGFPARATEDHVPIPEGGEPWIDVDVKGDVRRWSLELDFDWADPAFFHRFADLVAELSSSGALWSFNDGQSELFFVADSARAERLSALVEMQAQEWGTS